MAQEGIYQEHKSLYAENGNWNMSLWKTKQIPFSCKEGELYEQIAADDKSKRASEVHDNTDEELSSKSSKTDWNETTSTVLTLGIHVCIYTWFSFLS